MTDTFVSSASTALATDSTRVRFIGDRVVRREDSVEIDWQTIVEIRARNARTITFFMAGGGSQFNVLVNGELQGAFGTSRGQAVREYSVTVSMEQDQPARVWLVKRTEPNATQLWPLLSCWPPRVRTAPAKLLAFTVFAGVGCAELLPCEPDADARRIEIVGDSDAAAFGNEGAPTEFGLRTVLGMKLWHQNISNSWAHQLARALGAEPSVVAWSGVGAHQNAGGSGDTTLAAHYVMALASTKERMNFSEAAWVPHLVVLDVGGNDLWGDDAKHKPPASREDFVRAYVNLLTVLRQSRPAAFVLAVAYSCDTPGYRTMAADSAARYPPLTALADYIKEAVATYQAQSDDTAIKLLEDPGREQRWPEDGGAMEHWGTLGHTKFADALLDAVEAIPQLAWKRVQPRAVVQPNLLAPARVLREASRRGSRQ